MPRQTVNRPLKVVVLDPDGHLQRVLRDAVIPTDWDLQILEDYDRGELGSALRDTDVLVVRNAEVGQADLDMASTLTLVQKFGRRTENIDLDAASVRGIRVGVMPLEHGIWVAEHAVMLMLALTKRLIPAHQGVIAGDNPQKIDSFRTTQTHSVYNWTGVQDRGTLFRQTLGIVGLGEIGTEVAIRAASFDMCLLYYNPPGFRLKAKAETDLGVTYQPLHELLPQADYVTLHIPHTGETEGLMGREEFSMMKSSAYFINCSRGGVVDEQALCDALAARQIAGAGLDVFEYEPLPRESELIGLDRVVLTPHNAGGPLVAIAAEGTELVDRILKHSGACAGELRAEV
jgi:phosphoglycerate dehydrogenase-like enzyme